MNALLLATFVSVFVLSLGAGILLFGNTSEPVQIAQVLVSDDEQQRGWRRLRLAIRSLAAMVRRLERVLPKSQSDMSLAKQRLFRAGYRSEAAVSYFYGSKVTAIAVLVAIVLLVGIPGHYYVLGIFAAMLVGYGAPNMWLSWRLTRRQRLIRRGLPDLLDLLIVCMEAGLSLDQATIRTVDEMSKQQSPISDEVALVVLEQRAGCPRTDAWRHLAERTEESSVRSVVSLLIQSDQFGTSVAKTLRVHAESIRTERVQRIEEVTAKMSVKMLFPLVLLIFPAIFLVSMGPALILAFESFNHLDH